MHIDPIKKSSAPFLQNNLVFYFKLYFSVIMTSSSFGLGVRGNFNKCHISTVCYQAVYSIKQVNYLCLRWKRIFSIHETNVNELKYKLNKLS